MKLPNKFEFTTLTGTHTATLDGEGFVNVIWCKGHNNGDIDWHTCSLKEAEQWISEGGWVITKDLTLPKLKYPHKFSFTHDTTTQKYDMTYTGFLDYWYCTDAGKSPTKHSAQYNSVEIEGHFNRGEWKVVTDGEDSVPMERELVLPLVVEMDRGDGGIVKYEIFKVYEQLFITSQYGTTKTTEASVRESLEDGTWRVLSVGPQEPAAERRGEAECRCKPAEAPTSDDKSIITLSIKVDTEGAVERVKELTDVLENLTRVVEKLSREIELVTDLGSAMYVRER